MTTVPIDSYDPRNGQAAQLQFDSKEQLESFVKKALDKAGDRTPSNHFFLCKLANFGLALNLKDEEIKGLDSDEYPIILTINSDDDLYDFAVAYNNAKPVKRVTSKGKKEKTESAVLSFTKKEKLIGGIAAAAAIAVFIIISIATSKTNSNKQEAYYENTPSSTTSSYNDVPDWVFGTWSCTTEYGTETIKIDRNGEISDLSYGSYKTASYRYEDGYIKAKFPGEGGIVTTFRVDLSGHRIEYGEGIYMHKR